MINLSYKQQIAFNSLSIILGNALYALTVVLFLVPSGLITGGATGIALAVNKAVGLPVSGVLFVINITMLVLGWIVLGRRFAVTTVASTILSPMFLALQKMEKGNTSGMYIQKNQEKSTPDIQERLHVTIITDTKKMYS